MPGELNEQQIRQTAIILGLPADFIRKDYFVTKAIRLLTQVQNEYFELVFQGGTSLSKGYGIINRLSEDIDFRVIAKPSCLNLGKDAKRRELRHFRHTLVDTLRDAGFTVPSEEVRVFYEGRYMSIRAAFDGGQNIMYLKPHIAIDCFLGTIELKPQIKPISSMVKVTLGDEACDHQYFPVACVALDETASEKWVALSRRVVDAHESPRDSDKHLVRHLYDLHQLHQQNCLTERYYAVLENVIKKEQAIFDSMNHSHTKAETVLYQLQNEKKWEEHWNVFLQQMVYQPEKPDFKQAINSITQLNSRRLERGENKQITSATIEKEQQENSVKPIKKRGRRL